MSTRLKIFITIIALLIFATIIMSIALTFNKKTVKAVANQGGGGDNQGSGGDNEGSGDDNQGGGDDNQGGTEGNEVGNDDADKVRKIEYILFKEIDDFPSVTIDLSTQELYRYKWKTAEMVSILENTLENSVDDNEVIFVIVNAENDPLQFIYHGHYDKGITSDNIPWQTVNTTYKKFIFEGPLEYGANIEEFYGTMHIKKNTKKTVLK
jgi:hypothetical protein